MAAPERGSRDIVNQLKTIPPFSACSEPELAYLARFAKELDFPAGQVIMGAQSGRGLYIIVEGEAKMMVGGRSEQRLAPGAFYGNIAFIDSSSMRTAMVVAETPVRALAFPSLNLRAALREHPNLTLMMVDELARRVGGH